jgi:hypothetical protein
MGIRWMMLTAAALSTGFGMMFVPATLAAPIGAMEATETQLEKSTTGATVESEAEDAAAAGLSLNQPSLIKAAPGFSQRSAEIDTLLRAPAPPVNPLTLPIPLENFIYSNGGIGTSSGAVNQQYFRSCFPDNYGVLGGSSDRVLPAPVIATADSGVSPFLDPTTIARLQSLKVKFSYAFNGGLRLGSRPQSNSTLKLYVTNLTTGSVQFVGNLKPTTNDNRNPCVTVTQDLTPYIHEPGVYGLRLVMNNRPIRWFPLPGPYKAGTVPGDVVDLNGVAPALASPIDAGIDDSAKFGRPIFFKPKAVAGFNHVVVTVTRKP